MTGRNFLSINDFADYPLKIIGVNIAIYEPGL